MSEWMSFFAKEGFKLASDLPELKASAIPLPSPSFNWAVGNGGLIEGRWVLLFGPESGGKSLIAQLIMIEIQKKYKEGIAVVFDTEFSLNKEWFIKNGGDPTRLVIRQTNQPIEVFDWCESTLRPKIEAGLPVKVLGIDSIRALQFPKDQGDTTKAQMGGSGASYLTRALKKLIPVVKPTNITTILTQHVYEELDMWKKMRNPWVIPDGRTLRFYSDYMLQVEKLETKDSFTVENDVITGHTIRVTAKKNKVAAPFRKAEFKLSYNKGITNTETEIYDLGLKLGIICHPVDENGKEKIRSWIIKSNPEEVFTGEEAVKQHVLTSTEAQEAIMNSCMLSGVNEQEVIEE